MNYDELYEMTTEELVQLRNAIAAFRNVCDNWHEHLSEFIQITMTHPDFKTLWMNPSMFPEVLDSINGIIGKRNMKTLQERRKKK